MSEINNNNINSIDIINDEELSFNAPDIYKSLKVISNHVKVINASDFTVKFVLKFTVNNEKFSLNSGEFLPSYSRQITIPDEVLSINLIIFSVDYPKEDTIIYNSNLKIKQNYEFTVSGTISEPVVTEN